MKTTIQARLDEESKKTLSALMRATGWSASRAVREGLRMLSGVHGKKKKPRIAGLGQFVSGITDLGSNKKHLKGFGK